MIQKSTRLKVSDNSGGVISECMHIYGGHNERYCGVGRIIKVSLKSVVPNGKVKKGEKFRAVIVRTKSPSRRADMSEVKFSSNAIVLLNEKNEMLGTRVFGPVCRELRKSPDFLKIMSLASEVI